MLIFIIIIILIVIITYLIKNRIIIRIDTFFRKGFTKKDDKYGVYCFCGKQGDGKTCSLVDTVNSVIKNKYIICNILSLCQRRKEGYIDSLDNFDTLLKKNNNKNKKYIYEKDFNKICNFLENREDSQNFIIIYDEIFSLLEKGQMTKESRNFLSQMRKRQLYLYTTCQEWLELNITFRRYVRYQIQCTMFNLPFFDCAISINSIYDAYKMKWDNLENEYIAPIIRTNIKKCSKAVVDSYDTYETIEVSGKMTHNKHN